MSENSVGLAARPLVETLPPDVAELPVWMDAIAVSIWEMRNGDPTAGTAGQKRRMNSETLALAVQDVHRRLTDPNDTSGVRQELPRMAERADRVPDAFARAEDPQMSLKDLQSFAIPLVKGVNDKLEQYGLGRTAALEKMSRRNPPSLLFRGVSHLCMGQTRNHLLQTILGDTE